MSALPSEPASPLTSVEPSPARSRPRLTAVPADQPDPTFSAGLPDPAVPAGQPDPAVSSGHAGLSAPELSRRAGVPGSAASTRPRSATHPHVHPAAPRLPRSSAPSFRRPSEHPHGLRLTRRGRVVLIVAATLVASLLGFGLASAAMATDHHVPALPAHRGLSRVVVQPGQTLWSIAVRTDPSADPRLVEQRIIELNGLSSGSSIAAGQRIWIPQG
jgi:hypothetical protein